MKLPVQESGSVNMVGQEPWKPLSVKEIQCIFDQMSLHWWIAGGWALDLHLNRITREHDDIDVVILRSEHLLLEKLSVR